MAQQRLSRSLLPALAALLLALFAAPGSAAAGAAAPPVGDPVSHGVWRLHGTDPSLPQDDLAPLKTLIGRATMVGLGESIHTSGGFYETKHRLIRYLVASLGFRVVAMETPWVGADSVAAYVDSCAGTADEATRDHIFGVWRSQEVIDLVDWLCDWNRAHRKARDRVHFLGFDVQDYYGQNGVSGPALRAFLARIGIPPDDPRSSDVDACDGVGTTEPVGQISDERYQRCTGALAAIDDDFTRRAAEIVRRTSKNDFAMARVHLAGLRAWEDETFYANHDATREVNARDAGMAYALLHLSAVRYPKAKVVVWAHNAHVGEGNTDRVNPGVAWMGSHLAQALGANYFAVGFGAFDTEVDWPAIGACGPVTFFGGPGSAEEILHSLGQGDLLVAVDQPGVVPQVLQATVLQLGAQRIEIPRDFDALVYLERSPKMHPLNWPSCE